MSKDLMIPRYECIGDYPCCPFEVGEIIKFAEIYPYSGYSYFLGDQRVIAPEWCDKYPHLFCKLQWWEHRDISEMPEYVRLTDESIKISNRHGWDYQIFMKVKEWIMSNSEHPILAVISDYEQTKGEQLRMIVDHFMPATEQEYTDFITTNSNHEQ